MNPQVHSFAVAAFGRMEIIIQNLELQYNQLLQEKQALEQENAALKEELKKRGA